MGIAVADDLQVDVVGGATAGEHGVQLLTGLLPGGEAVHRVSGDALGGMGGAGVAEAGRLADVVGGDSDGEPAAVVPDSQLTVPTDMGDGPPIAVLDPVGGGQPEPPVVGAGDDHISDTVSVPVGQEHFWCGRGVVQAMGAGASVEVGDEVSGWGEHDGVESRRLVGSPSPERVLGGGGEVADMNTPMVEIEVKCLWFAFAEGERCCGLRRAREAIQLGELEGAVCVFDVAEDPAGAGRGELLIITDEPDTRTTSGREPDGGVEGDGVGRPGFVDDHQG